MRFTEPRWKTWLAAAGVLTAMPLARAQSSDALTDILIKKGILTQQEAEQIKAEARRQAHETNAPPLVKLHKAIKEMQLYGDMRFRYEYRGAETLDEQVGYRQRFRYALRLGIKGDLFNNFNYGLRLETAQNPRSPWVTFGDETSYPFPGPFSKTDDGIGVGQVYLGWQPVDWVGVTVGKMPNPIYTTPSMVWDLDLNPEGAWEKLNHTFGNLTLFAGAGQFLYQDTNPDQGIVSIPTFFGLQKNQSDVFMLVEQAGAEMRFRDDLSLKFAGALYTYTGHGQFAGFPGPFIGQGGIGGQNFYDPKEPGYINQSGINNLVVVETPGEINWKIGKHNARLFGDFAMNMDGAGRAQAAFENDPTQSLTHAYIDENKAWEAGIGYGDLGLVYGTISRKGAWEARAYWQHIEQYALDVNLIDSDFFEGRGNLEGLYTAFAYSFTDGIIGAVRYGYGQKINKALGTGGSNQDLPQINPINYYNLVQADLTWRF